MGDAAREGRIHRRGTVRTAVTAILTCVLAVGPVVSPVHGRDSSSIRWEWPLEPAVIAEPFRAPADRYGPGHRGVDLVGAVGANVRAPSDGVVAFSGVVVDRAILTIDHGAGYVSTLEPVDTELPPGARVFRGDAIGTISTGGHSVAGDLHVGVRLDGEYINPLTLVADVPRAVLLPCC